MPFVPGSEAGSAYATVEEFAEYVERESPAGASTRLLARASTVVDDMLRGAPYDVDSFGVATDAAHATAIREATCEQAEFMLTRQDVTGAFADATSRSVGDVSVSRGGTSGNLGSADMIPRSPVARGILRRAGLDPVAYR